MARVYAEQQRAAADSLLMNAYGTVYKFAVKNAWYLKIGYSLSPTEEMLSAKNLVSNLSSVLDYCCVLLYCHHHNTQPTPHHMRRIKFPCDFNELSNEGIEAEEWERRKLSQILGVRSITNGEYQPLRGIFLGVQNRVVGQGPVQKPVADFYLLHYLRNTLVHRSILIDFRQEDCQYLSNVLQLRTLQGMSVNAFVDVPTHPWLDESRNNSNTHVKASLFDVLYRSCRFVEECRDDMLRRLQTRQIVDAQPFQTHYQLQLTSTELTLNIATNTTARCLWNLLHLDCYGIEAEFKEELDNYRN